MSEGLMMGYKLWKMNLTVLQVYSITLLKGMEWIRNWPELTSAMLENSVLTIRDNKKNFA